MQSASVGDYLSWKARRGAPTLKIWGGCCRGVFAIWAVALKLPQMQGAERRSRPQKWGGYCRGVFAIGAMELRVPHLEGSKGGPRPQLWGACRRGVFAICLVTLTLPHLEGAKGLLALNVGGDAVEKFLQSGWRQPQYTQLEGAKGRFHPQNWGGCCRGVFAIWVVAATVHPVGRC